MSDIKTILVPFGGRKDEENAVGAAFRLAKRFAAQVKVLHISPDPQNFIAAPYVGMGLIMPDMTNLSEHIRKRNIERKETAKNRYLELVKKYGIEDGCEILVPDQVCADFEAITGTAEDIIAEKGQFADLIVVGRGINKMDKDYENSIISSVLFKTKRLVALIPPEKLIKTVGKKVVIACDGSALSIHAIVMALPFLKDAEQVTLMTVGDEEESELPMGELLTYLQAHRIIAQHRMVKANGLSTGAALMEAAKKQRADMLVMGAFEHSRLREMLLGGVTDFMLHHADIPVFMTH